MIWIALLMLALSWFLWRFNGAGFPVFIGAFVLIVMWVMK